MSSELKPLLTPEAVTELVLVCMKNLPRFMPRTFKNSYTPIAAAGTDAQVCFGTCTQLSNNSSGHEYICHFHIHVHVPTILWYLVLVADIQCIYAKYKLSKPPLHTTCTLYFVVYLYMPQMLLATPTCMSKV